MVLPIPAPAKPPIAAPAPGLDGSEELIATGRAATIRPKRTWDTDPTSEAL